MYKDNHLLLTELASPSCVSMSMPASCSRIRLPSLTCTRKITQLLKMYYYSQVSRGSVLTWSRLNPQFSDSLTQNTQDQFKVNSRQYLGVTLFISHLLCIHGVHRAHLSWHVVHVATAVSHDSHVHVVVAIVHSSIRLCGVLGLGLLGVHTERGQAELKSMEIMVKTFTWMVNC